MIDFSLIYTQLEASLNNQFLSGGLVLMIFGGLAALLRKVPSRLWTSFLYHFTVFVDVTSNDHTYNWMLLWINRQSYVNKSRRLSLKYVDGKPILVPARGNHFFFCQGRPVWLNWIDEEGKMGGASNLSSLVSREKITVRMLGRDQNIINRIVEEAEALSKSEEKEGVTVRRWVSSWDGWNSQIYPGRPISSVYLPPTGEDLIEDMRSFLGKKDWYHKMGIPFRKGYMFYGPPGNGKSTTALACASALDVPIHVLNLGAVKDDQTLEMIFTKLPTYEAAILLIEDIDTAAPDRIIDKEKKFFSLGTLLNMLDGILAKENLILIVTTNYKDSLDPALLRPGRIDRQIEFGNPTPSQIQRMYESFFSHESRDSRILERVSVGEMNMAQVQQIFLESLEG